VQLQRLLMASQIFSSLWIRRLKWLHKPLRWVKLSEESTKPFPMLQVVSFGNLSREVGFSKNEEM
jgi:hypothetical protein